MDTDITLLVLLASVLAGIVPTIVYVVIVWRIDRYEKEPLGLLTVAFIWGAVPAVVASAVIELLFQAPLGMLSEQYAELLQASLVAPPVEEGLKGLALLLLFWLARREYDGVLDGIIYGSLIGFGFAMTENVFYFVGAWGQGGFEQWSTIVLLRSLLFGFSHALFTSATGIGLGLARFDRSPARRVVLFLLGLGAATAMHFAHNFFLGTGSALVTIMADWSGLLVLLLIVVLAWDRERRRIVTYLTPEVAGGVLTPLQLEGIRSRRRFLRRYGALMHIDSHGKARLWNRLVAQATELAFRKHQVARLGGDRQDSERIRELRYRILDLRKELGDEAAQALRSCAICGRPLSVTPEGASRCEHCQQAAV